MQSSQATSVQQKDPSVATEGPPAVPEGTTTTTNKTTNTGDNLNTTTFGWLKNKAPLVKSPELSSAVKTAALNLSGMVTDIANPAVATPYSRSTVLATIVEWGTPRDGTRFRNKAVTPREKQEIKRLKPVKSSLQEFIAHLESGKHALPAPILQTNGRNVIESDVSSGGRLVILDYDGAEYSPITYDKMTKLADRLGFMFAPTFSASTKRFKARLIWITNEEATKPEMRSLRAALNAIFLLTTGEATDPAMGNLAQVIYGNNREDTLDDGEGVPVSASKFYIPEIILPVPKNLGEKLAIGSLVEHLNSAAPRRRKAIGGKVDVPLMMQEVVRYLRARGWDKGRIPGSGQYEVMFRVIAALSTATDCTEEVKAALASCGWTHLNEGEPWEQTWDRLNRRNNCATNKVSIGTLVHILREQLPDMATFVAPGKVLTETSSNFKPTAYEATTPKSGTPETHARQMACAIQKMGAKKVLVDTITGGGKTAALACFSVGLLREAGLRLPTNSKVIALVDKIADMEPYVQKGFKPIRGRHRQYFTTASGERVEFDGSAEHVRQTTEALDDGREVLPANSKKADLVRQGYSRGLDPSDIHSIAAILHGCNPEPVYKAQFGALKDDTLIVITKALFRALHLAGKIPEQAIILIDESAQMAASTVEAYTFEDIARSASLHTNGAQVVAIVDKLKEIAAAQRYAPGGQQLRERLIESLDLKEIMQLNRYYQTEAAALVSNRNSVIAQNAAKAGEHNIADRLFGNEPTIVIEALFQFALGNTETAITLSGDAVTVWKSDPLWGEALKDAALVIVADATQTPESLAPVVGAKPEDIGYLKSTQVGANNIRYTSYVCPGFTGDELSVKALQQVGRVADRHGIDSVLTKKSKLSSVRQACGTNKVTAGSYGRDSRGSNMFYLANSRRLLLAGLPIPNMGAVTARLSVELNREPTYEEISKEMNRITSTEVRQACGRLRANRHPEHQYEVVFLASQEIAWADSTTYLDLEEVTERQASESVQAYILQSSGHMVQTAIAEVLGVSQATVSRRLKDWGEFQVGAAATIALQPVEIIQEFLATLGEQATEVLEPTKEIIQWAEKHQDTLDPDEEFKFPNIVEMFLSLQDRLRYIPEDQWPTPSISNLPTAVALAFETAWAFIRHQWEMADETVAMGTEILIALRDNFTAREIAT